MKVSVFVMRRDGETPSELLVLPLSPEVATQQAYETAWNYHATVDTGDRIFGNVDAQCLETTLARSGFAVITPIAPDKR